MIALRKLLVHGLNVAVSEGRVSLTYPGDGVSNPADEGHIKTTIIGHPSIVRWNDGGHGEIQVSVWWKYDHSKHPQANSPSNSMERFRTALPLAKRQQYPKFVGVAVSAWLERENGPYLQGYGTDHLDVYVRRGEQQAIEALPEVAPLGYAAEGRFHL